MQSKVYGSKAGTFYSDQNVQLWMPGKLLRSDNIQVNYISGYGNGNLYISLMNQSEESIQPTVSLQPDLVPIDIGKIYAVRIWDQEGNLTRTTLTEGKLKTFIPAKGIVSLSVDGLAVFPRFQAKYFSREATVLSDMSYIEKDTPFGKMTGMIISMGASLTNAYIWLKADEKVLQNANLLYKTDQDWIIIEDGRFPFEYSFPIPDSFEKIEFRLEGKTIDNRLINTEIYTLSR